MPVRCLLAQLGSCVVVVVAAVFVTVGGSVRFLTYERFCCNSISFRILITENYLKLMSILSLNHNTE